MGAWNTLHLFDSDQFYLGGVPRLTGEIDDLTNDYLDFLSAFRIGGISNLTAVELETLLNESLNSLRRISNQFDSAFKRQEAYDLIDSYEGKRNYLNNHEEYYEFGKFFEYYIFNYYADFYPKINCGKYGLLGKLGVKPRSTAAEIIENLENSDNYFSPDGMGIVNWISKTDTEVLFHCKNDFSPKQDYEWIFNSFFKLVEIACEHGLGLIRGVDMREETLHQLPQFKLISKSKWNHYNFDGSFEI